MMATIKKRKRILLPESSSESELDDVESPKKDLPPAIHSRLKKSAKGGPDAKRLRQEEKDSGSEEDGDDSMDIKEDFSDDEVDTHTECRKTSSKNKPHSPSNGITPRRSASRKNIRYDNGESSSDSDSDVELAALRKDTTACSDDERDQLKNALPCDDTASLSEDDVEEISECEEKHPSLSPNKKASQGHEDCNEEEEEISGFEEQGRASPDRETVSSSDDEEDEEEEADHEKEVGKHSSGNPPRTRLLSKSKQGKSISSDDDSEYCSDDDSSDNKDEIDGDSPKYQRTTKQSKNKLKISKRQSTHKSPKKSQKISPRAAAKVLADSSSDENVDSARNSSSSDSDEPLSRTKNRLSSGKVHSKASSEPDIENDKRLKRDKPIRKGQKLDHKQKNPTSKKLRPHSTQKGKPKLSKMASEVLDSEEEDEERLFKQSKRGAALRNSESDSDHTKSSFTKGPVSKAKTKSPKLNSSKRKSSKERSGTKNAPHHKSKSPSVKSPKTNKARQKSHNMANYSESDSDNEVFESHIKIKSRKHGHTSSSKHKRIKQRRHHKESVSDKSVSSDKSESDSDNEALSTKKFLAKQKPSHKGGRKRKSLDKKKETDKIIVSSEDESDAVEIKVQCKLGSNKSQKNRKESPEKSDSDLNDEKDSSSDDSDYPHADRTGSAQGKARKHQETAKKHSQRTSFPEDNHRQNSKKKSSGKVTKERPGSRDESDDEDSISVSSALTISSLSPAEEEEEKQQTKMKKRKTEKRRASGSKEDASKKKSSSKSNESTRKSSVDGGGDAKSSSQKDSKRLELFKRFVRLSGLRVTYVKLFADVEDEREKIELLHKVLCDAGLKGKPTLAKCKQLREKRDELAELAALNMDNIIKGNSDTGRSRRRNVCSRYLKQSPGGHQASPSPKRVKSIDHFANLRSIISDDSDSD